ncbi:BAG family molecular chaperone regulator 4-like [Neltuma alba]|uniref:BAG family molecular chaperone regulator 4-like n=1 Tax=Neltuma alba TaxID=207710 RepID=UPI0010A3C742|nr:BAG family molecular chaperone regulator 4-like [Prosopis alba]
MAPSTPPTALSVDVNMMISPSSVDETLRLLPSLVLSFTLDKMFAQTSFYIRVTGRRVDHDLRFNNFIGFIVQLIPIEASPTRARGLLSTIGRIIKITISHNCSSKHEVSLPAESTFGDVKRLLAYKTGLEPEEQILIFRGEEKQDEEHLHLEGIKDSSEIFVFEDAASKGRKLEETRKKFDMSKACEAIAGVRAEVDQLSERMTALEVAVKCGTNVAENEFLSLSELLMRQLLKLDTIQAEGEARLQRKAEVCRVQSIVDKLDSLKEINSKPSSNNANAFPYGNGETFDSGTGNVNAPSPMSTSGELVQDLEQFNREFELRGPDEAEDPSASEALFRRRGKRLNLGAQVQEGTERGATSGASELEDPMALAHTDFHIISSTTRGMQVHV